MTVMSYTKVRADLASLCDQLAASREPVVIRRRNEDVALISADELVGLQETAHLLRSPANARRLLSALERTQTDQVSPSSVEDLRRDLGLGSD